MIKYINKGFGYLFLLTGLIGCVTLICFMFGLDITHGRMAWIFFGPSSEGSASRSPILIAIVSAVGAYLVKE